MSLLNFFQELDLIYQNKEKIADPENKVFIEKLYGKVYSDETLLIEKKLIEKVSLLYDEVMK